jgi:predicted esterase
LAALLRTGGADVTQTFLPAAHGLTSADLTAAKSWLAP